MSLVYAKRDTVKEKKLREKELKKANKNSVKPKLKKRNNGN